ncbi:MAG: S-layer homology domain-containing protein, partial [Proteobacteria bacterium]|nr:S-layer homology domain-containing protein [Pseudomonadota bacterium]
RPPVEDYVRPGQHEERRGDRLHVGYDPAHPGDHASLEERQRQGEDQEYRGHAQPVAHELPRPRGEASGGEATAHHREKHRQGAAERGQPVGEADDDTEHEKRINQLAAIGVVEGDNDGNYNAHLPVRRAAMASFLNRAYEEITGSALTSSEDFFTDDEDAFHEDNINAVAGAGIAAGKSSTTYDPSGHVKREQMATFLARETDLLVEKGKITKPKNLPADVKLASQTVPQGGKVTGTIDVQEGVEVTGAKVSGCGITDKALTLTGDDRAFEFTIPVTQPAGACKLTFTIDLDDGDGGVLRTVLLGIAAVAVTGTAVVMLTGVTDRIRLAECIEAGAVGVIVVNSTIGDPIAMAGAGLSRTPPPNTAMAAAPAHRLDSAG